MPYNMAGLPRAKDNICIKTDIFIVLYAMIKELLLILHRFNLITMNLVTNRNINPNYYNNEKV